jgi:hypothetical protein
VNHWYLVASLPLLVPGVEPPLAPETFRALCGEHLRDADLRELDLVLAGDPAATSAFARRLREVRRRITDEVVVLRASRLGIDPTPWRVDIGVPDATLAASVRDAMQQPDPKAREHALDALLWRALDELAAATPFGLPAVLAYGLKLQLAARQAARTEAAGRQRLAEHLDTILAAFDRLAQQRTP